MTISLRPFPAGKKPDVLHGLVSTLAGRRVAVVGLGKSGISASALLIALGAAHVDALDDKADADLGPTREKLKTIGNVIVRGGGISAELASKAELVVLSPGVPRRGAWWDAMVAAGTPWMGEVELAWRCTTAPWLCVTGTNGKSTTTTMLGGLVQQGGGKTFVGGNLGEPVCGAALAGGWDHLVVEMSSYQCEGISTLDALVAILTNLSPDHLDRYRQPEVYYAAKLRLFEAQSPDRVAVINAGDAESVLRIQGVKNARLDFNVAKGAAGVEINGRKLILRRGNSTEVLEARNPAIRGKHNLENAAAAVAAARSAGISLEAIQKGLEMFQAVPHRLQEVGNIRGVLYVNDSKGTNVDATVKALLSFEEPILLIAGGLDKGSSYAPMADVAKGRVKVCYTIGEAAPLIARAMEGSCPVVACGTMDAALARASNDAKSGEVALLSPACASFDQFKNYEQRGQLFADWVKAHAGRSA